MSLPTPTKTYSASPNNLLTTNGPLPGDYADRVKDIADWLTIATTQLIALSVGFTHVASCDSASTSLIGAGGPNLWHPSIGDVPAFRTMLYKWVNDYTLIGNAPWIVLLLSSGAQLCIGFQYTSGNYFRVVYSETAAFLDPIGAGYMPEATDGKLLYSASFGYSQHAAFNEDSQGVVNSAQDHSSYNEQIQVVAADDATGFNLFSFRDNFANFTIMFSEGLEQPVNGVWTGAACPTCVVTARPTVARLVRGANYLTALPTTIGVTWTTSGALLYAWNPSDGNNPRTVTWSALSDSDVSGFDLYPIPVYAVSSTTTQTGTKGVWRDAWWGQAGGSCNLYPSVAPTEFVQLGDVVVPWAGSTEPLFAA